MCVFFLTDLEQMYYMLSEKSFGEPVYHNAVLSITE